MFKLLQATVKNDNHYLWKSSSSYFVWVEQWMMHKYKHTEQERNVEKGGKQNHQSFIHSVVPVRASPSMIAWCILMYSYRPQVVTLMKCISPGFVCISVEKVQRVALWGDEVHTCRKKLFGVWCVYNWGLLFKKKLLVSHAEILLCLHRTDKLSLGWEQSAEVQRSIAERGRVRQGRIAVLCEFCQRTQNVQLHRELHSNLNLLGLNERP